MAYQKPRLPMSSRGTMVHRSPKDYSRQDPTWQLDHLDEAHTASLDTSVPENPPPATTNVSIVRRRSGSRTTEDCSSTLITWLRMRTASASVLNGSACSGSPGTPRKSVTFPSATTR